LNQVILNIEFDVKERGSSVSLLQRRELQVTLMATAYNARQLLTHSCQ